MPANPLNVDDFGGELFNLGMSEGARPLLEAVKTFIREEVQPMSEEFFALGVDGVFSDNPDTAVEARDAFVAAR